MPKKSILCNKQKIKDAKKILTNEQKNGTIIQIRNEARMAKLLGMPYPSAYGVPNDDFFRNGEMYG